MNQVTIIEMREADAKERTYGITYKSVYVFRMTGPGVHNRSYPHRVQVWDNTGRPNPHPGQKEWTEYGYIGGDGQYLDPNNHGTDDETSYLFGSECISIDGYGTGTGTPGSGQVWGKQPLTIDETVQLRYPDGTMSPELTVRPRPLADPYLSA